MHDGRLGIPAQCPDELTQEVNIKLAAACFQGMGGPGSPDHDDGGSAEEDACIVNLLGYLPAEPEELSPKDRALVAKECFGGNMSLNGGPLNCGSRGSN